MKYVSNRPGGFRIQIGANEDGTPKELVFPQGVPVDIPDELLAKVDSYAYHDLVGPCSPSQDAAPSVAKAEPTQRPEKVAAPAAAVAPSSLEAAHLPKRAIGKLVAAGYDTVEKLSEFVDGGGKLTSIKGISEDLEAEVIRCLGEV